LKMPAMQVFSILRASRERRLRERADYMLDMQRVVMVSRGNEEYFSKLRDYFLQMRDLYSPPEEIQDRPKYNDDEKSWHVPWEQATQVMMQQLAVKKRLETYG